MIIQRLYSKKNNNPGEQPKPVSPAPPTTPRPKKIIRGKEKTGFEKTVQYVKVKGKKLLKDPRTKKIGYIGTGALAGTLAVSGIDKLVEKRREKKKEEEMRDQIVNGGKK